MPRSLVIAGLAVALVASGCGSSVQHAGTTPVADTLGPSTRLVDLQHPSRTAALFSLFNRDQGSPRLVLLISPT